MPLMTPDTVPEKLPRPAPHPCKMRGGVLFYHAVIRVRQETFLYQSGSIIEESFCIPCEFWVLTASVYGMGFSKNVRHW